jgi:tripartite-type tricarboxylate transporter receptor subunit TctC
MATVSRAAFGAMSTLFLAALCLAAAPSTSLAQTAAAYPSKQIRVVVPLAPGGPTDTFARMFARYLETKYKQPVIVENKTGAGQVVGANYAVQQPADGYTMLAGSNGLAYESLINKDVPFNSTKDILPFGIIAGSGMFLHIHSSLPVTTLAEFIAWVKANPGKLNLGTASVPLAPFEGMRERLGLNWTYVNYKGGTPAEAALLAGEVQAYFGDSKHLQHSKTGRLRTLTYSGPQRHPAAPDVPTIAESGVGMSDFRYVLWLGMYTAAGVPEDILVKLNADLNDMSRQPDSLKRYEAMGWVPMPLGVDAVRKDAVATNNQIAEVLARGVKLR